MIHRLRFTKVQTAANKLKIIVRCDACGKGKQFDITPNQIMQYMDGKAKESDKWYYTCTAKKK